ncbi:MAG: ComEC/Rec2 family competence protein [Candidatus Omnitrophica bacterium]|nr:ComEC/Rec2 family competence protein [Candidatus Omnitrophota bacterium]
MLPCLALIAGIILANRNEIPLVPFTCTALALLPVAWLARTTGAFRALFFIIALLLSAVNFRIVSSPPPNDISRVPFESDARYAVSGVVDGYVHVIKEGRSVRQTFPLRVRSVKLSGRRIPVRGRVQCITYQVKNGIRYGDLLNLWGEISVPKRAANPGEFNYAEYLSRQGIRLQMSVFGERSSRVMASRQLGRLRVWVERIRLFMAAQYDALFEKTEGALLKALTIGDRREIPFKVQEGFVNTGTVHVLSISGLHMAMIGGCWYAFWRILGLSQRLNAACTILIILFYAQIAGEQIPVMRSACMGALFYAAILTRREGNSLNTLFLAAFLLLWLNPMWLFSISFQLSFLCVLSIILLAAPIEKKMPRIGWPPLRKSFSVSLATTAGAQALICFYFSTITPVSLMANLIIVPLITLVTISGFLILPLSCLPLAGPAFVRLIEMLIRGTIFINEQITRIPYAYWYVPKPHLGFVLGYYALLALFWFFGSRLKRSRWGVIATGFVTLIVVFMGFSCKQRNHFSITALAVQQTGIYLIQTPDRRNILINCGPSRKPDVGRWTTIPFLRSCGIRSLDALVLTGWGKRAWGSLEQIKYFFQIPYCFVPASGNMPRDFPRRLVETELRRLAGASEISGFGSLNLKLFSAPGGQTAILVSQAEKTVLLVASPSDLLWKMLDGAVANVDAVFVFCRDSFLSDQALSFLRNRNPPLLIISGLKESAEAAKLFPDSKVLFTRTSGAVRAEISNEGVLAAPFYK